MFDDPDPAQPVSPFDLTINEWGRAFAVASVLSASAMFMGALVFWGWWEIFD